MYNKTVFEHFVSTEKKIIGTIFQMLHNTAPSHGRKNLIIYDRQVHTELLQELNFMLQ